MATTAETRNNNNNSIRNLKPFVNVIRPSSKSVIGNNDKGEFEKLFEKWKRKQERKRKEEKRNRKSVSTGNLPDFNGNQEERPDNAVKLEPFNFKNPPKVLEVTAVKLVARKRQQPKDYKNFHDSLPKIVSKVTIASQVRRYDKKEK